MRVLLAAMLSLLTSAVSAQELSLTCRYDQTADDASNAPMATGEFSVVIAYARSTGPNNVHFKTTKAPCRDFDGEGDEVKVEGTCVRFVEQGMGPRGKMTSTLRIDRESGAFQQMVKFSDKPAMIHTGRCTAEKAG